MAPSRVPAGRRPISTRSAQKTAIDGNTTALPTVAAKRKADASPMRTEKVKRSALGNLTNAVLNYIEDGKKGASKTMVATAKNRDVVVLKKSVQPSNKTKSSNLTQAMDSLLLKPTMSTIGGATKRQTKVMTRAASKASATSIDKGQKTKMTAPKDNANTILKAKKSNEHHGGLGGVGGAGNNNNRTTTSNEKRTSRRLSNEFDLNENEESHYMSALEDW